MNPIDSLLSLMSYLVAFVPMLGVLVFVHELGHFMAAKYFGVRVLKFSLGFGAPIGIGPFRLRWVRGGTEYVIAWIPLGGYVKMLGEQLHDQGEDEPEVIDARPDEYLDAKSLWQKLTISFAGPAMNLLLPVVILVGLLAAGLPRASAVIGTVEMASPAAEAGLLSGDRVTHVSGEPALWWSDVVGVVREADPKPLALRVDRGGEDLEFVVPVQSRSGLDEFGLTSRIGWIGVGHRRLPALLGVPDHATAAGDSGLRSGDLVVEVQGQPVEDWASFRVAYEAVGTGGTVELKVQPGGGGEAGVDPEKRELPALGSLSAAGIVPATILVQQVTPDMPADRAGLESGDLILAVDAEPIGSFATFAEMVRSSEGRPLMVTYARGGETVTVEIAPEERSMPGPLEIEGMEEKVYLIGITHALPTLVGVTALDREVNPFVSIPRAVEKTLEVTQLFLVGLGKLATGEVGTDKLTGPIGIAEISKKTLDRGWLDYLQTLMLISINLGIINLLPIPVLDGGQALMYIIEGVQRSPISVRTREIVQSVGLTMVLMLLGLAFWNDLSRHWTRFFEWLQNGL